MCSVANSFLQTSKCVCVVTCCTCILSIQVSQGLFICQVAYQGMNRDKNRICCWHSKLQEGKGQSYNQSEDMEQLNNRFVRSGGESVLIPEQPCTTVNCDHHYMCPCVLSSDFN